MKIKEISYLAKQVREGLHGSDIPIDVREMCRAIGIRIYEKPIMAEAFFLTNEGKMAIILKENVNEKRKRFSLAHELGHVFIPNHAELVFSCTYNDMQPSTKKPFEQEANFFASELLIPSEGLLEGLHDDIGIDTICQKAESYYVSMSAMAIKLTQLTSNSMAVFYIEKGRVKWACKSDSFDYEVNNGCVGERSSYWKLVNSNEMRAKKRSAYASEWIIEDSDIELNEEAIYFPQYDTGFVIVNQIDE